MRRRDRLAACTLDGTAPIRIARDEGGVPHVQATTEADVYRGLGYCHGVDRGLQMLLVRILAQGRGSELLEPSDAMLAVDRFFRRLNFVGRVAEELGRLAARDRVLLQAYCDGVTVALGQRVPWELRLLRVRPEPWRPADVITLQRVVGYVALAQSQGDMERLLVEMVQAGVPRALLEELFPHLLDDLDDELVRRVRLGARLVPESVRWSVVVPRLLASNNWVVAGSRTASGQPLLANDPHLEANRLPAVWYEAVLELDDRFCLAATMPGLPAPLVGRTNDLAWGATYTFMDATDSWIEECRDGCFRRVVDGAEQWVPFQVRTEVLRRKGRADVVERFYENLHGVLDGDPTIRGLRLATRWSAADGGAVSLAASLRMLHAGDVHEGREHLGRVETAWNWVLADRHGNIAYQMSGRLPRRGRGNGLVPLPGWEPGNDWQGWVDPLDLPRALNPGEGFLVTANDDLNDLGTVRALNLPMGDHRARRIRALLAARSDWTVAETQAVQMDVYSVQAEQFMAVLRPLLPDTAAGAVLRDWDCRYGAESYGATAFERVYRALLAETFGRVCGAAVVDHLLDETGMLADFYANFDGVLLRADSAWYGAEGRDAVWRRVAARVLEAPPEPWGTQQRITMTHLLFGGRLPRWMGFDLGPLPLRGGRATVHQGQVYRSGGRTTSFAPSFRLVTDFGEAAAHTTLAGGPSDRRFSRWYVSGVADWLAGRFKVLQPTWRTPATGV